ncbi:MAG: acyltransferase family protein [Muribaculaceae bacterium]
MANKKTRIEYFDFMKGLCIILILAFHIDPDKMFPGQLNPMLQSFRIPMYYFLSGIFFKTYNGFVDFARHKVNNIIVPYLFFMFLTNIIHCISFHTVGYCQWEPIAFADPILRREYHYNTPLWFLLSLFEVNIIYYVLNTLLKKRVLIYSTIAVLAFLGWYFRHTPFLNNQIFFDTALIALPYFVFGSEIKRIGFVEKNTKFDKWGIITIIPVFVFVYFTSSEINLFEQRLPNFFPILYIVPFIAVFGLFWFCKNLPKIPVINYIGRYSLIVLGTHSIIILVIRSTVFKVIGESYASYWVVLAVLIAAELIIIPIMIKFFPKFTAQEELIKPCNKSRT